MADIMRAAMEKAAEKNPNFKALLIEGEKLHKQNIITREKEKRRREDEEKEVKAHINRSKILYKWNIKNDNWHLVAGICWASNYDEAMAIVRSKYPDAISYNVSTIDCSIDCFTIVDYIE